MRVFGHDVIIEVPWVPYIIFHALSILLVVQQNASYAFYDLLVITVKMLKDLASRSWPCKNGPSHVLNFNILQQFEKFKIMLIEAQSLKKCLQKKQLGHLQILRVWKFERVEVYLHVCCSCAQRSNITTPTLNITFSLFNIQDLVVDNQIVGEIIGLLLSFKRRQSVADLVFCEFWDGLWILQNHQFLDSVL